MTDEERQSLRRILSHPDWKVIESLINQMVVDIREQPLIADTEWETLKNTIAREYEVRALRRFMQNIIDQVSKS